MLLLRYALNFHKLLCKLASSHIVTSLFLTPALHALCYLVLLQQVVALYRFVIRLPGLAAALKQYDGMNISAFFLLLLLPFLFYFARFFLFSFFALVFTQRLMLCS